MGLSNVIGLYTCSCHLFESYEDAIFHQKKKLPVGTKVKNRCTGNKGVVYSLCDAKGYVIVKYGPLPKNRHLQHVQELLIDN